MNYKFLSLIYLRLLKKENIFLLKISKNIENSKKPFLYLSAIFDRDIFTFDAKETELEFYLIKKEIQKLIVSGYKKFIMKMLKLQFFYIKKLVKIMKRSIFNFFDSLILVLYLFYYASKNSISNYGKKKENIKDKLKLYSVTYLKKQKTDSDIYYYKGIRSEENAKSLITSFYPYRSTFRGLIESQINQNYLNQRELIDISCILELTYNLFNLLLFDFFLFLKFPLPIKLKILDHWSRLNNLLFTNLNYILITRLSKRYKNIELFNWAENQLQTKSFSISYLKNKYISSNNIKLSTFYGFPFSKSYFPHFVPSYFEIKNGLWGELLIMQDNSSIKEMKDHLKNINISINVKKTHPNYLRFIKDNLNKQDIKRFKNQRNFTIFTHATLEEFIVCVNRLTKNLSNFNIKKSKTKIIEIWIRRHPAIPINEIENFLIKNKNKINLKNINYKIIDNSNESIQESILNSNYCVFGESGYINMAIGFGVKTIAIRTSYKYKNPIQDISSNLNNLFFI